MPSIEAPTSNMVERSISPPEVWTPDSTGSVTPVIMDQHMYSYEDIAGVTDAMPNGPLFAEDDDDDMGGDATLGYPSFVNDDIRRVRRM